MTCWRVGVTLVLALAVGWPLVWPVVGVVHPDTWPAADTWLRLASLARQSGLLLAGTLLLVLPAGLVLAVLLERTDLPGRRLLGLLLLGTLLVPLPLFTSAWQVVLGPGGWLPLLAWAGGLIGWAPWALGVIPAAVVHALAGLPWVVLLVGWGLRAVERDLEEDALLLRGPAWVLWHVSLPRCLGAVAAAALLVGVMTTTEITVTDVMQVRTFAEEVYTQFNLSSDASEEPLPRAVAGSLGAVALSVLVVVLVAGQVDRLVPAGSVQLLPAADIPLRFWRWPVAGLVWAAVLCLVTVPLFALLWRAGLTGMPSSWSVASLAGQLAQTVRSDGAGLLRSLALAATAGALCAALALVCCWLAREAPAFRLALLLLLAVAWTMPGPVLGMALKGIFRWLLDRTDWPGWLARLLWYGPSPVPLLWVDVIRFLPFAVALVWPVARLLPRELLESARLDGAGPWRELTALVAPLLAPACLRAGLAVAILSLGELSAGKLVSTPGAESFAEVVFTQMHTGVTADLAARCLLLLSTVLAGAVGLGLLHRSPASVAP